MTIFTLPDKMSELLVENRYSSMLLYFLKNKLSWRNRIVLKDNIGLALIFLMGISLFELFLTLVQILICSLYLLLTCN